MLSAEDIALANCYVQSFLKSCEALPIEIQPNISEITEYDIKINKLIDKLKQSETIFEPNINDYSNVEFLLNQIQELSEEKLRISSNVLELLENSLKNIDCDRRAVEKNEQLKNIFFNITVDSNKIQNSNKIKKICPSPYNTNLSASNTPMYSINSPNSDVDEACRYSVINSPYYSPTNIPQLTSCIDFQGNLSNFYSDPDLFSAKRAVKPIVNELLHDSQNEPYLNRSKRNRRFKGYLVRDYMDSNYIYGDKYNSNKDGTNKNIFLNDVESKFKKKKHKLVDNDGSGTPSRIINEDSEPEILENQHHHIKGKKGRPSLSVTTMTTPSSLKQNFKTSMARKKHKLLFKYLGRKSSKMTNNVIRKHQYLEMDGTQEEENLSIVINNNTSSKTNVPTTSNYDEKYSKAFFDNKNREARKRDSEKLVHQHLSNSSEDECEANLSDHGKKTLTQSSIYNNNNNKPIPSTTIYSSLSQSKVNVVENTNFLHNYKKNSAIKVVSTGNSGSGNRKKLANKTRNLKLNSLNNSNHHNHHSNPKKFNSISGTQTRFSSDEEEEEGGDRSNEETTGADNVNDGEDGDADEDNEEYYFLGKQVDPDEPTYCLCNRVSYGEMIGCDYPKCAIEWYHFDCVNLSYKPKGKWFCPKCRKDSIGKICKFPL